MSQATIATLSDQMWDDLSTNIDSNTTSSAFRSTSTGLTDVIADNTVKTTSPVTGIDDTTTSNNTDLNKTVDTDNQQNKTLDNVIDNVVNDTSKTIDYDYSGDLEHLFDKGIIKVMPSHINPEDKDDYKYSKEDFLETLIFNFTHQKEDLKQEVGEQLIAGLSSETRKALEYELNGGKDVKAMYKILAQVQEVLDLKSDTPEGQENIIREKYKVDGWSSSDIDEEIENLKDRNELEKYAKRFEPKLKADSEAIAQAKVEQEKQRQLHLDNQRRKYESNLVNTLKGKDLGNIQIDEKKAQEIYNGIIATSEMDSLLRTTLFGDAEKNIEPDFKKLAKIYMLLKDEDGLMESLKSNIKNTVVASTVKDIKFNSSKNTNVSGVQNNDSSNSKQDTPKSFRIKTMRRY